MISDLNRPHGPALAAISLEIEVKRQQMVDAERNRTGDVAELKAQMESLQASAEFLKKFRVGA